MVNVFSQKQTNFYFLFAHFLVANGIQIAFLEGLILLTNELKRKIF